MDHQVKSRHTTRSVLIGAIFLMATSSIGPGFLTQTALFTSQLGASFGFAILLSIFLDIGAQLNIWRILIVAGMPAQEVGNKLLRGLGDFISVLVALGGLAFNIGNIAGCALGLNVLLGLDMKTGALLSGAVAFGLFLVREARAAMDKFALTLGIVMIALTLYVTVAAAPPLGEALVRSFVPLEINVLAIVTLVGGTVGGYITFAGAHRLLDAGVRGEAALPEVSRSATTGILLTGVMRALLFLAALGVITHGGVIDAANPPASVFRLAAGDIGYRIFGLVMWSAAVTSVVGASYTSASFLKTLHPVLRNDRAVQLAFIFVATIAFLLIGRPVRTLVVVGALNGMILPISLGALLIAAHKRSIVGSYKHAVWLALYGAVVVLVMSGLAIYTIVQMSGQL